MVDSNRKGARRERELRNYFREMDGYEAIRTPASGSGTTMDLPDLFVGREGDAPIAVEAKSGAAGGNIYVKEDEVDALLRFAAAFNAVPMLAGRWDGDTTWYFEDARDVPRTDGGNYRLDPMDDYSWTVDKPEGV